MFRNLIHICIKNIPRFNIRNTKNLSLDENKEESEEVIKISDSDDDNENNLINNKKLHNIIQSNLSSGNRIKSVNTNDDICLGKKTRRYKNKKK